MACCRFGVLGDVERRGDSIALMGALLRRPLRADAGPSPSWRGVLRGVLRWRLASSADARSFSRMKSGVTIARSAARRSPRAARCAAAAPGALAEAADGPAAAAAAAASHRSFGVLGLLGQGSTACGSTSAASSLASTAAGGASASGASAAATSSLGVYGRATGLASSTRLGATTPRLSRKPVGNHPALNAIYEFAVETGLPCLVHHNADRVGDKDGNFSFLY